MKYIIKNDINYMIKKEFKIIIIYFAVAFLCPIFLSYDQYITIERLIYGSLGFGLPIKYLSIFEKLISCFSIITYLYLIFKIFTKDILNNMENLFLRISARKWLLYKIISVFLSSLILMFIYYNVVAFTIFLLKNNLEINLIHLFIKNIEFIWCLQLLAIVLYVAYHNNKKFLFYLLVTIILSVFIFHKQLLNLNMNESQFITIIIFILILIIFTIISKNMKYIFEKIKEKMI